MKRFRSTFVLIIMIIAAFAVSGGVSAANTSVIDFTGLAEGQIVSSLSSGNGISGAPVVGTVAVSGQRSQGGGNAAMVFDSTCGGGGSADCTGGDPDLYAPDLGNTMIVSEDGNSANPDDNQWGGTISFDFSNFGPGVVDIPSVTLLDTERSGKVQAFNNGDLIATSVIPVVPDGGRSTINLNAVDADLFVVTFIESGAVDNIVIETPETDQPTGDEGCTPGYWKSRQHLDSWQVYSPDQTVNSVFDSPYFGDDSLRDALQGGGGRGAEGGAKILLRAATAGLLNIASDGVAYEAGNAAAFIADVNAALQSGDRGTMLSLAGTIDDWNNAGCPLN